jgi:hypothetical protein
MDGRCQEGVAKWCKDNFQVDYADTVTIAGADKVLAADFVERERSKKMAEISKERHGSKKAAIVGHSECAGNPVSFERHCEDITKSANAIKEWDYFDEIVGLYVDVGTGEIKEVCRMKKDAALPTSNTPK